MKLLIIHNFYTHLTGEDLLVKDISQLLKNSGMIKVAEYYKYSQDFHNSSWIKKIIALFQGNIPFYVSGELRATLDREKPDIALIHNLVPLINPWAVKELRKRDIPIIFYNHNFRIICPRGTCVLKDKFCIRCFNVSLFCGIMHNCLGNFLYSLLYAYRVFWQRLFLNYIDSFVLSNESWRKLLREMLHKNNIAFINAYVSIPADLKNSGWQKKDYVIFAGRLVKEKGVDILLQCAALLPEIQFKICGDGPLMGHCCDYIKKRKLRNIELLGLIERKKLLRIIRDAQVLICPSFYYEFGFTAREAMLLGTPVIALKNDVTAEWITHNKTGFLFAAENIESLVQAIRRLREDETLRRSIALQAYELVKEQSNPERYILDFLNICNNVLSKRPIPNNVHSVFSCGVGKYKTLS